MKRYILEATWSGYRSSQQRACHREVITKPTAYEGLAAIVFTDGTNMRVDIRECKPREQVQELRGYPEVFSKLRNNPLCKKGYVNVMDI